MSDREFGFQTRALHAGTPPDGETGARALPVYMTSSFVFDSSEAAAELFALRSYGNIYSRIGNPTVAAFEEKIASLEGGLGCGSPRRAVSQHSSARCLRWRKTAITSLRRRIYTAAP